MGVGFLRDLRSVFIDDYKDAVRQTSGVPAIFMDPDAFNRKHYESTGNVHPDDIDKMKRMLERQMPGITKNSTDADMRALVEISLTRGPMAQRAELTPPAGSTAAPLAVCIVNEPGRLLNHKNEILPLISRQDIERIREIPGWTDHWERIVGIHEGTHCNDPLIDPSGMTADQLTTEVLRRETLADQAAVDWARRNGLNDMAQTWIDMRALGAIDATDPEHATAILIDRTGPVTLDHVNAARNLRSEMVSKVATDRGISEADANTMLNDRPEEFNGHVKRLLGSGAFDGNANPHMKRSVEAFSGAVDRQITDRRIERELEQQRRLNGDQHGALDGSAPKDGAVVEKAELPRGLKEPTSGEINFSEFFDADPVPGSPPPVMRAEKDDKAFVPNPATRESGMQMASYDGSDAIVMPSTYADMDVSTVNGGAPVVALNDGDKASMTIGGVSASAFFASHADNDLAQQRIALEQDSGVGLERDFQRSSPSASSYGMA